MNEIWVALSNTPWWVYALFIYLVMIGIKASNTRVISIKKLFIIPVIFTYLSIHTLITSFDIHVLEVSIWGSAILIGTLFGWAEVFRQHRHIKVDKTKHLIQVPGSWMTLILILVIFASKYYFGYELDQDPELIHQNAFEYSMLIVSGICTGLFIGRALCYLNKYINTEHTPLSESD